MKKILFRTLDKIAKDNGYEDIIDLYQDYNIIPTVMIPRHKKAEIIPLLLKHIFYKKR